MPDQIFISYRREDAAYVTGHINDLLRKEFGSESVFTDVDNIALGVDFRAVLDDTVSQCHVLLAVIGDSWISVKNDAGESRLHDPADFVRIEIESALKRNIPVIPLLVGRAAMPKAEQLPDSLKDLAFRNGTQIRPAPDFNVDMERLIRNLRGYLQSARKGEADEQALEQAAVPNPDADAGAERDPATERRKSSREKMLVGEDERVRKQVELGIGAEPPQEKRWGTRLWVIAALGVAALSWYYVSQNPEALQEVIATIQAPDSADDDLATNTIEETSAVPATSFSAVSRDAAEAEPSSDLNAAAADEVEAAAEAVPGTVTEATANPDAGAVDETGDEAADGTDAAPVAAGITEVVLTPGTQRQADAAEFIREGISLAAIGDHEAAIQNFDEAIRLDIEPAFVYRQRAASYHAIGQDDAAISDYDEAIRLNGEDVISYYNRGAAHAALQNHAAAIADFDVVIQLDPEFADAYSKRADAHEAMGNAAEAARDRATVAVFESNRDNPR